MTVRLKKLLAFFLLFVISMVIVPKELIHHWVDHTDTEDVHNFPDAPFSIEHEHEHCEFLKINVPLYHDLNGHVVAAVPFFLSPIVNLIRQHQMPKVFRCQRYVVPPL